MWLGKSTVPDVPEGEPTICAYAGIDKTTMARVWMAHLRNLENRSCGRMSLYSSYQAIGSYERMQSAGST